MIPYGRHKVEEDDIAAVADALRSDRLTCGPRVTAFENALAARVGAAAAAAVNSGTAALHSIMNALGVGPGDEVIVPPITFAATANCVVFQGATPVFADVSPDTLLIDPQCVEKLLTPRTRAVVAVDYAGQPCDYDALRRLTQPRGIALVADACHALGATRHGVPAGSLADLSAFSFHPVKHITTGEGGMVTAQDPEHILRVRRFRSHGMSTGFTERESSNTHAYEIAELGYNYRISDIQCALGLSQLGKLDSFLDRRRHIAAVYSDELRGLDAICPLALEAGVDHAWHLYVIQTAKHAASGARDRLFVRLRERGVGVNVHYVPVHLHPFYRQRFNTAEGLCPVAEAAYGRILSLPIHPCLSEDEQAQVLEALRSILAEG